MINPLIIKAFVLVCCLVLPGVQQANGQRFGKKFTKLYGMVLVGDSVWVDDTEITIDEWMEYALDGTAEPIPARMPTSNPTIDELFAGSGPKSRIEVVGLSGRLELEINASVVDSGRHFQLLSIPITNITFAQAKDFCRWRTEKDGVTAWELALPDTYEFDLPAPTLFDQLCLPADSVNKNRQALFNFKKATSANKQVRRKWENYGQGKVGVANSYANNLSLYDMKGNVAEMTTEPGVAKGGSYLNYAAEMEESRVFVYVGPADWLGFRCVARKKPKLTSTE
jgi:formylglycine-generating enzyme required for sulfatase activity